MALINCIECGHKVSTLAEACPECGCPVSFMIGAEQAQSEAVAQAETAGIQATELPAFALNEFTLMGEWEGMPIGWQVIATEPGRALLLATDNVVDMPFHNAFEKANWETCSLRVWLNDAFLTSAFTPEDQAAILLSDLRNVPNPEWGTPSGGHTQDRVFILSIEEARRYIPKDDERYLGPDRWLRSAGDDLDSAAGVSGGKINDYGWIVDHAGIGVRPAMWVRQQ